MVLSILRLVYSLLFVLALPIIFCRLAYKGRHIAAYRQRWAERLGFVSFVADKNKPLQPIWVHAASMGEFLSAVPLIKGLRSQHPDIPILITTMTATGSERVQSVFKNELNNMIFHSYIPYDIGWVINRFLNRLAPRCLIILETELWPNLMCLSHEKNIPILIANARLTPKSVSSYKKIGWIMEPILNKVTVLAAQSILDVERYTSLGLLPSKIQALGNLKYDVQKPDDLLEKGEALRKRWDRLDERRPVWIAASTHPGEEALMLSVFANLRKKHPNLLLLLVPRHPERFEEVYQLCLKYSDKVLRKTQNQIMDKPDIFLGDTLGELWHYYAASDCVFLGGSLVPIGGHNLLEPAALGLPIIIGPHRFTIAEISERFIEAHGLKIVEDTKGLEEVVDSFLSNPQLAKTQGLAAFQVVEQNRGALSKLLKVINEQCLNQNPYPKTD